MKKSLILSVVICCLTVLLVGCSGSSGYISADDKFERNLYKAAQNIEQYGLDYYD